MSRDLKGSVPGRWDSKTKALKQDGAFCVWRMNVGQCGCSSVSNGKSGRKGGWRGSQIPGILEAMLLMANVIKV